MTTCLPSYRYSVGTLPELHHALPELRRHVLNQSADLGIAAQFPNAAPDCLYRTLRGFTAFRCEEGMETSYIGQRGPGPD